MTCLVVGVVALSASAQAGGGGGGGRGDRGGGGGPGGGGADFRARRDQFMKDRLGVNDDEWKILQPRIQKVQTLQQQTRGGFGGRGRGGPGGGPGADQQPETEASKASAELRTLLENKDAPAAEIKAKLTALRQAREKAKVELTKAQAELREVASIRQEAQFVMMGLLE